MPDLYINHVAVFVCALANLGLGALWYSPLLFFKGWKAETGLTDEQLAKSPVTIYGLAFLFALLMSYNLAFFLGDSQTTAA